MLADHHIVVAQAGAAGHGGRGAGMHSEVSQDINKMFTGRSVAELLRMQDEVSSKLQRAGSDASVDAEYWEAVAKQLRITTAKAWLQEFHRGMLQATY